MGGVVVGGSGGGGGWVGGWVGGEGAHRRCFHNSALNCDSVVEAPRPSSAIRNRIVKVLCNSKFS